MLLMQAGRPRARSARPETRNPILGLPLAIAAIASLEQPQRDALARILTALASDARKRAQASWTSHKGPMALYWKCLAVYARHIALALAKTPTPTGDQS